MDLPKTDKKYIKKTQGNSLHFYLLFSHMLTMLQDKLTDFNNTNACNIRKYV